MDDKQSNKHKMYLNLKSVCIRNQSIWSSLPAFTKCFEDFVANIDLIDQMNTQRQASSKSHTGSKNELKENMANTTLEVVGALKAYASVTGNTLLAKELEVGYSDIIKAKDTDADDICLYLVNKVGEFVKNLADYGVTKADVTRATGAITLFSESIGKPKSTITQIKSLNEQNSALFKSTDRILEEQLDNLMQRYKVSNPAFYNEYFSARRIGGNGGGKKEEEVKEE